MSLFDAMKRVVVGRKLASAQLGQTLLPKRIALPVFASDALSSVAYAPDEVLLTLSLAGLAGLAFSVPIGIAVGVVMVIVVLSYRQTVHAYPSGGGDYEVVTTNLGPSYGLIVASALLVDYILTVAVSVSSGVQNAKAVFPAIGNHEGVVAAIVIVLIMTINLRGVRESGRIFAVPVYGFMIGVIGMTAWGLFQVFVLGRHLASPAAEYSIVGTAKYTGATGFLLIALLARTFSSGCAALTGVEAISNGVPNFRKPKSKNAATTLALLGTIAVTMLLGIITLARLSGTKMLDAAEGVHFVDAAGKVVNYTPPTVMGQISQAVFTGWTRPGFYFVMAVTVIILFLAANTAFNGFPTLGSILARDGYLPRQLHTRGDRLAFSNGIMTLAAAAVILVLVFNASVTALIQLYVVGVFVSFTLSQIGMVHHWTQRLATETDAKVRSHMVRSRIINTIGLVCTGLVLIIVLVSKFIHGAWASILAMVIIYITMRGIHRHYDAVSRETKLEGPSDKALPSRVHAVVLVSDVNRPTVRALEFARATRPGTLQAVTVGIEAEQSERLIAEWDHEDLDVPLTVIDSPYRQVTQPFLDYVRKLCSDNPRDIVSVYVPEVVVRHWWEQFLHNQTTLVIKTRLTFMPGVMVTSVPYQLDAAHDPDEERWRDIVAEIRKERARQEHNNG